MLYEIIPYIRTTLTPIGPINHIKISEAAERVDKSLHQAYLGNIADP